MLISACLRFFRAALMGVFILAAAGCASPPVKSMEGTLQLETYANVMMLITNGVTNVVYVKEDAALGNIASIRELGHGELIGITYSKEKRGVKLAESVYVMPAIGTVMDDAISVRELARMIAAGDKLVLADVRPFEQYRQGRLPGAISVPLDTIGPGSLGKDNSARIVLYAANKRDHSVLVAMARAREAGYINTTVLAGGAHQWGYKSNYVVITPLGLKERLDRGEHFAIVDVRDAKRAAKGHLAGAISMDSARLKSSDVMQSGMPDPLVVYGSDAGDTRAVEASRKIAKAGYADFGESPAHLLLGGFAAWKKAGYDTVSGSLPTELRYPERASSGQISYADFRTIWDEKRGGGAKGVVLLDLRRHGSVHKSITGFILNIELPQLPFKLGKIDKDKDIVVYCTSGFRARVAQHILQSNGYRSRYLNAGPSISPDGSLR